MPARISSYQLPDLFINRSPIHQNYIKISRGGFKSGVLKFLVLGSIQQISSEEACKTDNASLRSLPRSIQLLHLNQARIPMYQGRQLGVSRDFGNLSNLGMGAT
jgi:hypothetical protein